MATGQKIKAQIAVIPNTKCELCEENDISWKCFNCEEFLCHQCKKVHLKSKLSRDHRVTTIEGADKREQHAHDEKKEPKCSLHPEEFIAMYCKECDIPICADCIVSGSHKFHTILKIKNIIDEKQRELSSIITESNQKLSEFEQNMTSSQQINTNFTKDIAKCIKEVKSKNVKLKATLDQITNDIITKLREIEKQNKEKNRRKEKITESEISELKEIILKCKNRQAERETELIQFVRDVKQRLQKLKPSDPPKPHNPPIFVSGDANLEQVKALFGYLHLTEVKGSDYEISTTSPVIHINPTIDVKIISTFSMEDINTVATVTDNQAWVYQGQMFPTRRKVILVTLDGKVIQTKNTDFDVYDMAVTKSGELVVTVISDNKVKKLTSDVKFVDVYVGPAGYETRGITVTDNNYIIVCLYNHGTKEGKLVQLTPAGQQKTTVQYDSDGKTPLFDNPWKVSSNRNGDLIVVNETGKEVVVVDKTGHKRFTYTGQMVGLKNSFGPWYTVTDQFGHIIVNDRDNLALHLLDKDGNFLQLLLSNKHGINQPWGMSIDKSGRLWMCDNYDKIMVVKYV